ncbi:MAG: ArsA family ATPase [Actinotalea sp.]|nr:ArsA family ATPase [Actinotalea sp.]
MLLNLHDLVAARRVVVVGGKGGVGKTAVSSAVALGEARRGRRVLLVSTDPAHNLGHLWGTRVGDAGTALVPGLDAVEIDPERTTEEHLQRVGDRLRRLMPPHLGGEVDRHLALARDAPGMHEAAILERVAEVVEESLASYDLLVLDTAPSGHTARLMALPESLTTWTDGLLRREERARRLAEAERGLGEDPAAAVLGDPSGHAPSARERRDVEIRDVLLRRRARFALLRSVFTDAATTAFVVVLAAERLPVLETVELERQLRGAGVHVGGLVVNKRSPADGGPLLAARREHEDRYLKVLDDALPDVPRLEAPLLAEDLVGEDGLARFAGALGLTAPVA